MLAAGRAVVLRSCVLTQYLDVLLAGGTCYYSADTIIGRLRPEFAPGTYNVLTKNCNVFSRALVQELLGEEIPGYVK